MGFLRIHCGNCGGTWEVYGRDNWKYAKNKVCPHCFANIDGQDWEKAVVPAFGEMLDLNRTLKNTATGYNAPLFAVDYIADSYTPGEQETLKHSLYAIDSRMNALRDEIENATECINEALRKAKTGDANAE